MCVVSMVLDHGRAFPPDYWTPRTVKPFIDLIDRAKTYDRLTKQPDCEDPEKAKLIREILERLKKLEGL